MSDFSNAAREHVRQLIFDSGLSQNAFAAELGRSQSSISQLLTGNRHGKDLDVWQEIAGYFGRSLSQLIAEVETLHLQQKLTSSSAAQLAVVREDLHADIIARRKQLHQSQDVIENPTMMAASITTAPIPSGDLDGDRRSVRLPTDPRAVFVSFQHKPSPTLSRLLLQQDIETLVQTDWKKRNQTKLQRLFESIASRIELLVTVARPGDEHAEDGATLQALDPRAAADPQPAAAPRRSHAQSRPTGKPRTKGRQLRQRA